MRIPSPPKYRPKQVYARRLWNTDDMLEILSIYHGAVAEMYPRTWAYRTLIIIHRDQNSTNAYGKGYGPDWKSLVKKEVKGQTLWVSDGGFAVKHDLLEYAQKGRLPLRALQLAASELRRVQMAMWVNAQVRRLKEKHQPVLLAA